MGFYYFEYLFDCFGKTTKTAVFREAMWHGSKCADHLWTTNTTMIFLQSRPITGKVQLHNKRTTTRLGSKKSSSVGHIDFLQKRRRKKKRNKFIL